MKNMMPYQQTFVPSQGNAYYYDPGAAAPFFGSYQAPGYAPVMLPQRAYMQQQAPSHPSQNANGKPTFQGGQHFQAFYQPTSIDQQQHYVIPVQVPQAALPAQPAQEEKPQVSKREKKPIAIIDPKTEKQVIVDNADRSGASTPDVSRNPTSSAKKQLTDIPNATPNITVTPSAPFKITPETLTPPSSANSTTDNIPESVTNGSKKSDSLPNETSPETVTKSDSNSPAKVTEPVKFNISDTSSQPGDDADEECTKAVADAQPKNTVVKSFFSDLMNVSISRPSTPVPRATATPDSQAENSDEEKGVAMMRRTYSRDRLLELKGTLSGFSTLPGQASLHDDIVIRTPPMKRLFKAKSPAEEICREVTSILNKMTGENFEVMTTRLYDLLNNEKDERMLRVENKATLFGDVVRIIFMKAISEPKLVRVYAKMFTYLNRIQFSDPDGQKMNFRILILHFCQREFEQHDLGMTRQLELEKELENAKTPAEVKDASENLEEFKNIEKAKYLGNIRLIGELYRTKVLPIQIVQGCIDRLSVEKSEDALESLCKLLRDVGKQLEEQLAVMKRDDKDIWKWWKGCIEKLYTIIKTKDSSPRIRFFIQDVLDARKNDWNFSSKKT